MGLSAVHGRFIADCLISQADGKKCDRFAAHCFSGGYRTSLIREMIGTPTSNSANTVENFEKADRPRAV